MQLYSPNPSPRAVAGPPTPGEALSVLAHGVVPDGVTLNTAALQAMIDRCRRSGGGTLYFPAGRYLSGGLVLCSRLRLYFDAGATLLGSPVLEHYPHYFPSPEPFPEGYEGVRALLSATDCGEITLEGPGTIDGQGGLFDVYPEVRGGRPRNLWFARCRDIRVSGLRLRNSGFWMQHYLRCEEVRLSDLDIWNHAGTNNDGIDIDGCRDVFIRNCRVDSSDDAICLKSGNDAVTENVIITDCLTRSHCNHFKTGTESRGGFRNIRVSHLVMTPSAQPDSHPGTTGADPRGACGIALGAVDGGSLSDIVVENIRMDQVQVPFFIRLGNRGNCPPGVAPAGETASAARIRLSGIEATGAGPRGCHIIGLPDAPVHDVTLENSSFEFAGGGTAALAQRPVALRHDGYPSCDAFGELPAYGVYCHDTRALRFSGLMFRTREPEARPALLWLETGGVRLERVETLG